MRRCIRYLVLYGIALLPIGGSLALGQEAPFPSSEPLTNARREAQILARFNTDQQLRAYDLIVLVRGDKAMLGGTVGSDGSRQLAGRMALAADGIVQVDNAIRVEAGAVGYVGRHMATIFAGHTGIAGVNNAAVDPPASNRPLK